MRDEVLLGDEAVAQAALDAGIGGAFSYPGTPATEIFEYVEARAAACGVSAKWSANEKVAYEEALGMCFAGRRALVSMKHVGLNVAADPFMSSALTGVHAGLVLAVADDPGMHSSQNEQDSRCYAEFAHIPVLEPSSQQECYDLTRLAFDLSEEMDTPVMVRLVTRLAHSRSNVRVEDAPPAPEPAPEPRPTPDWRDWTLLPMNARRRFLEVVERQHRLLEHSERSPFNTVHLAGNRGVIASGLAWNYVSEALSSFALESLLKIVTYPIPVALVRKLVAHCDDIVVVEEGQPFIESRLNGLLGLPGKSIRGKLTGALPRTGELTPDLVLAALGREAVLENPVEQGLAPRPPGLCRGCPHADTFRALAVALKNVRKPAVFGDIGCYTLGALPPYGALNTCVDMGASIAMAHGAVQAGAWPVLCVIGDSTFLHSGMTPLVGAARANADMTVILVDNETVGMTGTQESIAGGERLLAILRGLGVDESHLCVIDPLPQRLAENAAQIEREIQHRGLSVIVSRRACVQATRRQAEQRLAAGGACCSGA
ncbi:MAG: indolepyruvate ferredoxin oxidoreductase [Planctomycetes bacterium]|nr:indolepyruvate ferredoxin oxidoreductase [Planctomycetota bacterium]